MQHTVLCQVTAIAMLLDSIECPQSQELSACSLEAKVTGSVKQSTEADLGIGNCCIQEWHHCVCVCVCVSVSGVCLYIWIITSQGPREWKH